MNPARGPTHSAPDLLSPSVPGYSKFRKNNEHRSMIEIVGTSAALAQRGCFLRSGPPSQHGGLFHRQVGTDDTEIIDR